MRTLILGACALGLAGVGGSLHADQGPVEAVTASHGPAPELGQAANSTHPSLEMAQASMMGGAQSDIPVMPSPQPQMAGGGQPMAGQGQMPYRYSVPMMGAPEGQPGGWQQMPAPQGQMMAPQQMMTGQWGDAQYGYPQMMTQPPMMTEEWGAPAGYADSYQGDMGGVQQHPMMGQDGQRPRMQMMQQRMAMMQARHAKMDQWMDRVESLLSEILVNQRKLLTAQKP